MIAGVTALYLASEVLIPVAAAVLLAFALSPLVRRLERWRVPRVPSVVIVMAAFLTAVGLLVWLLQGQAMQLATDLPQYKSNIAGKLATLRGHSTGALDKATATIKEIGREIAKQPGPDGAPPPAPPPAEPAPVRIVDATTTPLETARSILGPVFGRLATGAIVVVFSVFILVQREEL
ncbi:MAG: AI-2E family transporter, partial [Thermoleophilia bacterium]|nr:AI-2E family transporter [Thermoleophilia bacterium]